jgi:hypothetical protein
LKQLRTLWSAALLTLSLCFFMAPCVARAQEGGSSDLSQDWSLRLGIFVANANSTVGFSGIVERRVHNAPNYEIMVGAGFNGNGSVYAVPIMINVIGKHANARYGGGIGYTFGKRVEGNGFQGVAYNVILGYRFVSGRNPMNVDLRWFFVSGCSSELNGPSITWGVQF